MSTELQIETRDHTSLVFLTNGLPVLERAVVSTDAPLPGAVAEVRYEPEYIAPVRLELGTLKPGATPLDFGAGHPDIEKLSTLTENVPGRCVVTLEAEGREPVEAVGEFTWLPPNVWVGRSDYPDLLAALVLPNDPVVDRILRAGADLLQKRKLTPAWVGYKNERNAIINQIHALWNAVEGMQITYSLPPRSWADFGSGQKVRTPSLIAEGGCATCLDTTALLAAVIAQAGYNPIILLCPGHAFVGAWLKDDVLASPVEKHPATLRNLVDLGDILLLETTAVTRVGKGEVLPGFAAAQESAVQTLRGLTEGEEFFALDIVRLWATGIRPVSGAAAASGVGAATALPAATDSGETFLPEKSREELEEEISLVARRKRTRMENWQLHLLDLSLRNNLLNSRIDRTQITLMLPGVAALEDALADGKSFSIRNVPETFGTLVANRQDGALPPEAQETLRNLAAKMFSQKQILALPKKGIETDAQLERRVRALYLAARHDMEESGSSTLNLACGFLKWYRPQDADTPLYAPILLVPVKLTRPSVKAGFSLQYGDEDTRINLTLLQLLKTEYGIDLSALEEELPTDDSGVDVPLIFKTVRQAIRDCPGWEVVDRCALGTYSFAKYLMWKDMADRKEALMNNAIVRHLAADHPSVFPAQVDFPAPDKLDSTVDAKTVFTPLSADSSQLAAVLAAARGKNFVLIGPPGTGKSQTIANMVAHCLGHGKTVLFVAEKSAALNVVYKRLKRIGLGDFCLELHSNKANKKAVIAQFKAAVDHAQAAVQAPKWNRAVGDMERLRATLNALPQEMHRPYPDGTSLFSDICRIASHPDAPAFIPCPQDVLTCNAEQKDAMLHHAHELALRFTPVADMLPGPAAALQAREYSFAWEESLVSALGDYSDLAREWQGKFEALLAELPIDPALAKQNLPALLRLLRVAELTCGNDVRALLPGEAEDTLDTLRQVLQLAETYRKCKASLSLPYPDSTLDTPGLDAWLREWKEAQISNFISRFFTCRRIRKALQLQAFSRQTPDCQADLTALITMRDTRNAIRTLTAQNPLPSCIRGLDTTQDDLAKAEEWAGLLQGMVKLRRAAEDWLVDRRSNPVAPGKQAAEELRAMRTTEGRIADCAAKLGKLLGCPPPAATGPDGAQVPAWVDALLGVRDRWRELTLWNEQAATSASAGYAPMVQALLARTTAPDDLAETAATNFSRLRLKAAVGSKPELNRFTPHEQESRIRSFAEKDADVLSLASEFVLATLTARAAGISADEYRKELGYLQHEISKQRAHKAPRTLLSNIPHIATLLKPCMLMSPLSVAQYLDPAAAPFDVVIFDEASQIPVWDAIGAIARGRSAVIVGDPRQMPPTSFFARAKSSEEETDEADDAPMQDMESILDECRAGGIPEMNLTWHYRSKAESLIAFSNHNYYEGKLTTFPAPVTTDTALQYHHTQGTYLRGAGKRINPVEAKALVDHVLQTLRAPGFRYTEATSIGIVTFNTQQQKLIEDLLEDARAKDPSLEPFFSEDNPEAVFVKNLENVQGDERGSIYFSTTYGPDEKGVVSMNFGPLNLTGGERRLNVAITRARASMHVFTSLSPSDIDLNRTKARGAADLKDFLQCAAGGVGNFFHTPAANSGNSAFSKALADGLKAYGWSCVTDLGVSDFRIDLAVEHPDHPGAMLAAIRTDGPGYAAACTARDRDILRESVLSGLGWRVFHLWALDWWRNPQGCLKALDAALRKASAEPPCKPKPLPSLLPEG